MRKLAAVALPVALVTLALVVRAVAGVALAAFTAYETPFAGLGASAAAGGAVPPTDPLSPQVVIVLVDGLGLAASRSMPFLDELRARGADYDTRIGLPSLSLPGRAVMATGAWQEIMGQATNFHVRPLAVESLFTVARRAGLRTGLTGGRKAHTLFSPGVTEGVVLASEPETAPFDHYLASMRTQAAAAQRVLAGHPGFALVELDAADEAGHGWGAASREYAQAVAAADAHVRELAGSLDLTRATLVVTADHGHVPEGGHGGPEEAVMHVPLVMAGQGVRAGIRGTCRQIDIAPTVAALLGLPVPAANQGRPLVDALALDPAGRLEVLRRVLAQRASFLSAYAARLGAPAPANVAATGPADESETARRLDAVDAAEAGIAAARLASERRARLPWAVLLGGVPLVVLGLAASLAAPDRRELARAALAGLAGFAAFQVLRPALGLAASITAINKDEWLESFFRKDMALGVACVVLAAGLALMGRRARPVFERSTLAWVAAAVYAALFVIELSAIYAATDVVLRWHMPDQRWAFTFYLAALAVEAAGFASPALAVLAAAVGTRALPRPS